MKWAEINGVELGVCGLDELPSYARTGVTHLISIWPGGFTGKEAKLQSTRALFETAAPLFLFFNDVTDPEASYPPAREDVAEVLRWTKDLKAGDRLLVHCSAGVSRSTALVFSILCQHWGEGFEIECFVELMALRPIAVPNPLLVAFADELLQRGGQMQKAIIADRFLS